MKIFEEMDHKFFVCMHIEDFHRVFTIWVGLDDLDKASPSLNDTQFFERWYMYRNRYDDVKSESRLPQNDTIW